jgi:Matrixin
MKLQRQVTATGSIGPDITADVDPSNPASVSFAGGVRFSDAPSDTVVSAKIDLGVDHFSVRDLIVFDWVLEAVDLSDLPPGHRGPPPRRKVLEFSNSHEGAGSINLKSGQVLLVRIKYLASLDPSTTSGNLSILGQGWDPVNIPLLLTSFTPPEVTIVETRLLQSTLTIVAGRQAQLPIEVRWISGPSTNIAFEKSPVFLDAQVSMQPISVRIEPQQTLTVPLIFQAAVDARIGTFDLAVRQYVSKPPFNLALQITIVAAPPNPRPTGRVVPDCVFGDPPGTPVISPKAYGLKTGFPRMPSQFTFQIVGTPDSGTLPTPTGAQSLLSSNTPSVPSALGIAIPQALGIWASAFSTGPRIAATLTNDVADIQFNTGTLNANPAGGIAGRTREFSDAEVSARGGRHGVQITFDTSNFIWRTNFAGITPSDPVNTTSLLAIAIHEIGHGLGLLHNTNTNSVMFHSASRETLGFEDIAAINALYGWAPQRLVQGVGTEACPGLCSCGALLAMAWRGTGSDHNIYFVVSTDGVHWSESDSRRG